MSFITCPDASGTHQLKLLMIGKGKCPTALKNVHLPLIYKHQDKASVIKEVFYE